MKKQFLILFAFISVLALSQVPQRFNKVIATGDITSPKLIKTGSNADSVLLGNGSARAISTIKTDTVSLSNRINAKATGNGTANGTNTGDETLTSIKTKLGAATAVSDGYLKYQDWSIFNSKEPSFSKNTAFNKNFGTTTGTVLEGRTFGTAANSSVGDFIQNQNSSAQTGNLWIDGKVKSSFLDINAYTPYLTITSNQGTKDIYKLWSSYETTNDLYLRNETKNLNLLTFGLLGDATFGLTISATQLRSRIATGTAPLIVNSTTMVGNLNADLLDGNHASAFQPIITGIGANNIPKWNGSSFVNSLISDDGNKINISNNSPRLDLNTFSDAGKGGGVISDNDGITFYSKSNYPLLRLGRSINSGTTITTSLSIDYDGNTTIPSTTTSTSPTNGALVVGGGVGADHVRANNFYGNGSNLTGVQLPITLTTNGTSGAATFSGNVLNVPNYTSNATSGTYSPTVTLVSGLSSSTSWGATYTKNGNNYHVGTAGELTTNATGTCAFRFTLPYPTTGTFAAIIPHIYGVSGSYIASSWSAGVNSSTIEITFTSSSPTASRFYYNIMIDYY